jgi:NADPH-dependent 2,4-dienoyl-CoA reductase/sulfur reductase-like enzyme
VSRLVVIGGSDAGTEAALRARRADPSVEVTLVVADDFVNYSVCGLPFFVSGEVETWQALAHRDRAEIADQGIELLLRHRATAIDPSHKMLEAITEQGPQTLAYDSLIIATGAEPARPPIVGLDLDGVFVLHTMGDGIALRERLDRQPPSDAIVIGSGYIGVELADALARRGINVTLVGRAPSVLPSVDPQLGAVIETELARHGVTVVTGAAVDRLNRVAGRLEVSMAAGRQLVADLVVVGAGVRPNARIAASAGASTGIVGAIVVNERMETTVPSLYAAGDCVETWHAILERPTYIPLGTTAHKQGRVAGVNATGGRASFRGSVGTQVVKVFDLAAARTGLSNAEATAAGFSPVTVETSAPDHKRYYPGAKDLRIRITGDAVTRRLLGAQIVGHWQAEVAKRIDIAAIALLEGLVVADLTRFDLSYTPPLSSPWDPMQIAADAWENAVPVGRG